MRTGKQVACTVAVALVAAAGPSPAQAAPTGPTGPDITTAGAGIPVDPAIEELTDALQSVLDIPDAALVDDEKFAAWQAAQRQQATVAGVVGCSLSIAAAVAGIVFSVSKVLKIRSAIKAAGGARTFAELAIKGFRDARAAGKSVQDSIEAAARKASVGASDAFTAILDLFAARGVLEDCFGVKL